MEPRDCAAAQITERDMATRDPGFGRLLTSLWAVATAAVVAALWATMVPAHAAPANDIIVPTDTYNELCTVSSICATDNSDVWYYMDSVGDYEVEAAGVNAMTSAMEAWGTATDVTVGYDTTPKFSGEAETDVVWRQRFFSDDTLGVTYCVDRVNDTRHRCDSHYIEATPLVGWKQEVLRHEVGHALGLVHGPQAAPLRTKCAPVMAIMRAHLGCIDSSALGAIPKNNVDWVY